MIDEDNVILHRQGQKYLGRQVLREFQINQHTVRSGSERIKKIGYEKNTCFLYCFNPHSKRLFQKR
jgi:hypothetical protein